MKCSVSMSVAENGKNKPEYTLETNLNGEITLSALLAVTKAALIVISDNTLKEEQAKGFDKNPVVVVDGKVGAPIASVHPLGKIEYYSRTNLSEVIRETYRRILERSPVLTGLYKKSNFVMLNNKTVASDEATLESWLASNPAISARDEVKFVNTVPYARKLERLGVRAGENGNVQNARRSTSKRGGVKRTRFFQPNGAYFLTSRSIIAKYGKNANVKFQFATGSQLGLTGTGRIFINGKKGSVGRTYLYPSIVIRVREGGTL